MAPSKEAMAAAEKLVYINNPPNDVPHIVIFDVSAPAWTDERAEGWRESLTKELAQVLDDHTADLRAEAEALRAERDKLKVWLKDKRFATENEWRGYRITQDYCNGAMSAFGEVIERLSE